MDRFFVFVVVALMAVVGGCRSQKTAETVTVAAYDTASHSAVTARSSCLHLTCRDSVSSERVLVFDSLEIIVPASRQDSLSVPVRIRAVNGSLSASSRRTSLSALSVDITDSVRSKMDFSRSSSSDIDSVAVYEPPDTRQVLPIMILLAFAALVMFVICRND